MQVPRGLTDPQRRLQEEQVLRRLTDPRTRLQVQRRLLRRLIDTQKKALKCRPRIPQFKSFSSSWRECRRFKRSWSGMEVMKVPWNLRWCDIQLIFHAWLIGLLTRRLLTTTTGCFAWALRWRICRQQVNSGGMSLLMLLVNGMNNISSCHPLHVLPINLLQRPR